MNFAKLYENGVKPVISFEVFPHRTPEGKEKLIRTLDELAELSPEFISVTYGAMGTTRENGFEIASYIKNSLEIETASHLTCVGSSAADMDRILTTLKENNIENIVALRGDPPENQKHFTVAEGGYSHANELVSHIRNFEKKNPGGNRFGIAVAGYPEKHIEASSMREDIENLGKKTRAGADLIITQLFYDNFFYFDYTEKVKESGIQAPIVPGLMPILSTKQVLKITSMCGSTIPRTVMKRLEKCDRNNKDAGLVGMEVCAKQVEDLLDKGVPGIHFYVLNRATHIKSVLKQVGL